MFLTKIELFTSLLYGRRHCSRTFINVCTLFVSRKTGREVNQQKQTVRNDMCRWCVDTKSISFFQKDLDLRNDILAKPFMKKVVESKWIISKFRFVNLFFEFDHKFHDNHFNDCNDARDKLFILFHNFEQRKLMVLIMTFWWIGWFYWEKIELKLIICGIE